MLGSAQLAEVCCYHSIARLVGLTQFQRLQWPLGGNRLYNWLPSSLRQPMRSAATSYLLALLGLY